MLSWMPITIYVELIFTISLFLVLSLQVSYTLQAWGIVIRRLFLTSVIIKTQVTNPSAIANMYR